MDPRQGGTERKGHVSEVVRARPDGTRSGRWFAIGRSAWVAFALVELVQFIGGIFAYATQLHTVCSNTLHTFCNVWQPTPGNAHALAHLGISLGNYAAYFLTVDILVSFVFWVVGVLIFWRRSDAWIGLLVSFILVLYGASGISDTFNIAFQTLHAPSVLAGVLYQLNGVQWPAFGLFLLTFPDGRLAPRWSWIVLLLWIIQLICFSLPPPFNIFYWPVPLFAAEILLTYGSTLAVQVVRYVRVYDRLQRQQTKWLLFGLAIFLLLNTLYLGVEGLVPDFSNPDSIYLLADGTVTALLFVPIPLALGFAILRYRLWDIDLIINRTLVYGTLSVGVIGLYVLVVVGLGTLMQAQGNIILSLLATALIAVLFQPLRLGLQRGVNRLMYGERDDPYAVLARLGNRLEATLVPEKVLPTIVETIAQALKLPYVAIALLPEKHSLIGAGAEMPDIVASSGMPTADLVRVPLVYQAETVGYLLLAARAGDMFGKADRRLLTDLARQAGVAVYAVRLTSHLQRLTVSLQQARVNLVTTREEERRRLRRDLHDGLGPALASLTFKVDAARNLLAQDSERTETLLAEIRQQVQEAISDIRRLVYNLRPPVLDEFGLLSALREQAVLYQHQGLHIEFETPSSLPPLPAAVEVAVYRIAQEALTNVVRHAQAQHCLLRLSLDTEALQLDISDDGQGIAAGHRIGVGLHTMHERASELGGSCSITPGSPGGPTIQVRLPLTAARDALPTPVQHTVQPGQEGIPVSDMSLVRQED